MNESLLPNIRSYAKGRQLDLIAPLGSGKDGIVLVARNKANAADVAVKALRFEDAYWRERDAYRRLGENKVEEMLGFEVPQLLDSEDNLRVLEMTIVKRPFVLDFAGAYLDHRPEFPADVWADWETEKREQFEGRWPTVQKIMDAFEELGIFLLDVTPNNIGFVD